MNRVLELPVATRRAAVHATLAPSIYNTQPWRLVLSGERLTLYADWTRRLPAHDPLGRQLLISCGCALMNARVSLSAEGLRPVVERFPGGSFDIAPVAVVTPDPRTGADQTGLAPLAQGLSQRRTNRTPFTSAELRPGVVDALCSAADQEGLTLIPLDNPEWLKTAMALHREAAELTMASTQYRSEHRAWAAPSGYAAWDRAQPDQESNGYAAYGAARVMLLTSPRDGWEDWLRTGEALERVLLLLTVQGYVASLSSQITQLPSPRAKLQDALGLDGLPQVLMQVGTAEPSPPTRRRLLIDVISESP